MSRRRVTIAAGGSIYSGGSDVDTAGDDATVTRTRRPWLHKSPGATEWQVYAFGKLVWYTPTIIPRRRQTRIDFDDTLVKSRRPFILGAAGVAPPPPIPPLVDAGPGRLYAEIYSAAGAKLGFGPIFEILEASITDRLDQGGDWSMTIPADDERALLPDQGREIRIYREGEGIIFRGLIENLDWQVRE